MSSLKSLPLCARCACAFSFFASGLTQVFTDHGGECTMGTNIVNVNDMAEDWFGLLARKSRA